MRKITDVTIPVAGGKLFGTLGIPETAKALVIFAHGSGSGRFSVRNRWVADHLGSRGFATLLFDLLTPDEEAADTYSRAYRFDIPRLSGRLAEATRWAAAEKEVSGLPVGFFGASTGAAAALIAAAELRNEIFAVVSRGGRPDLAGDFLPKVASPVLLIVGGNDEPVIELNREAFDRLECEKEMKIVPEATHLFEEPGTLEIVANLAADWFTQHAAQRWTDAAAGKT
jgi:putative phosphoribosyl transferase